MGTFSWITKDSGKPIYNRHTVDYHNKKRSKWNHVKMQTIYMHYMINGKRHSVKESDYKGYGVFGEKDYFVIIALMNMVGIPAYTTDDEIRTLGIDLSSDFYNVLYPILTESMTYNGDFTSPNDIDPGQGDSLYAENGYEDSTSEDDSDEMNHYDREHEFHCDVQDLNRSLNKRRVKEFLVDNVRFIRRSKRSKIK